MLRSIGRSLVKESGSPINTKPLILIEGVNFLDAEKTITDNRTDQASTNEPVRITANNKKKGGWRWRQMKRDYRLYLMLLLPITYFFIFKYIPMYGITIAFKRFQPGGSMLSGDYVGLLYFKMLMKDSSFWSAFRNTFVLSISSLLIGFPIPIIFALLLNEVRGNTSKRVIQTITYLPRFLSTVVVVSMMFTLLSPSSGIVNAVIEFFGGDPVFFMNEASWFKPIYIISDVWQFMGWNAILYIAALAGVDQNLYEAAKIDGAGKWKQVIHVTLPGIMPTIVIMLILAVGNTLNIGFEKVLLMYNPKIYATADILQTYIYRLGLASSVPRFSSATAAGLFQAVISLVLLWSTNMFARKNTDYSLW